ncbi:hypothetical protein A4S06_11130 [Erysipelotrichaceae bacterium MTC7]|nr:hypothetical protein A4S06_11130 [Erysipelotrichaceae bacterium MTC7]
MKSNVRNNFFVSGCIILLMISMLPVSGGALRKAETVTSKTVESIEKQSLDASQIYELNDKNTFASIIYDANNKNQESIQITVPSGGYVETETISIGNHGTLKNVTVDTTQGTLTIEGKLFLYGQSKFDYIGQNEVNLVVPQATGNESHTCIDLNDASLARVTNISGNYQTGDNRLNNFNEGIYITNNASIVVEGDIRNLANPLTIMNAEEYASVHVKGDFKNNYYGINADTLDNVSEAIKIKVDGLFQSDQITFTISGKVQFETKQKIVSNGSLFAFLGDIDKPSEFSVKAKAIESSQHQLHYTVIGDTTLTMEGLNDLHMTHHVNLANDAQLTLNANIIGKSSGGLIRTNGEGSIVIDGHVVNLKGLAVVANDDNPIFINQDALILGIGTDITDVVLSTTISNDGAIVAWDKSNIEKKPANSQVGLEIFAKQYEDVCWVYADDGSRWLAYNDIRIVKDDSQNESKQGTFEIGIGDDYEYHSVNELLAAIVDEGYSDLTIKIATDHVVETERIVLGIHEQDFEIDYGYECNLTIDTSDYGLLVQGGLSVYDTYRFDYIGNKGVDLRLENSDTALTVAGNGYARVHSIESKQSENDVPQLPNWAVYANNQATVVVEGSITNVDLGIQISEDASVEVKGDVITRMRGVSTVHVYDNQTNQNARASVKIDGDLKSETTLYSYYTNLDVVVLGTVETTIEDGIFFMGEDATMNVKVGAIEGSTKDFYAATVVDSLLKIEVVDAIEKPLSFRMNQGQIHIVGTWTGASNKPLIDVVGMGSTVVDQGGIINHKGPALSCELSIMNVTIGSDGYLVGKGNLLTDVIGNFPDFDARVANTGSSLSNKGTIVAWDGKIEAKKQDSTQGLLTFGETAKQATWHFDENNEAWIALAKKPLTQIEGITKFVDKEVTPEGPSTDKPQISTSNPQTSPESGDTTNAVLWIVVLAAAGLGIVFVIYRNKKK